MTIAEIIRATVDSSPVQFIHESLVGAQDVKKKKDAPAHTRVTLVTEHMTCNDAFYWGSGGGEARKPKYVGIIVWIPRESYEQATTTNAVDPSAQLTGTPTPRDAASLFSSGGTREDDK